MDFKSLQKSLIFGIPHSKVIDNILELRDPNIQIDYYSIYAVECYRWNRENSIHYVLPIFSFDDRLYCLTQVDTNMYQDSNSTFSIYFYLSKDTKAFVKDNSKAFIYKDLGVDVETFEDILYNSIKEDKNLMLHLISRVH